MHSLEDQYIQLDDIEKGAAAGKKEIRDELVETLKAQESQKLKLSQVVKEEIDEKVFLDWCKKNLSDAEYKQLFTLAFDPNNAVHLMRNGTIDASLLPSGWQKVSITNRILRR